MDKAKSGLIGNSVAFSFDEKELDKRVAGEDGADGQPEQIDVLGSYLWGIWEVWKDARLYLEEEWLKALRAYHGEDEADVTVDEEGSDIYVHITRTKVLTAYARLVDIYFQGKNKHWGLDPVDSDIEDGIPFFNELTQSWDMATGDQVKKVEREIAEAMAEKMDDDLSEMNYARDLKCALFELCLFGSGCLKGVFTDSKKDGQWVFKDGEYQMSEISKIFPNSAAPSIFDVYPDPYANTVDECSGLFERHLVNKSSMQDWMESNLFEGAVIETVLINNPNGNHVALDHEVQRRSLADNQNNAITSDRYEVLEYTGDVSGDHLIQGGFTEIGNEEIKRHLSYKKRVLMCDGKVIYCKSYPNFPRKIPYHIAPYDMIPGRIWGEGVAISMLNSQQGINDTIRAAMNNLGQCSSFQTEIFVNHLADDTKDDLTPYANKKWLRDSGDPAYPAVRFFQPDSHVKDILLMMDVFRRFVDEETNQPSYTHGAISPGMNKTARGTAMLMNQANITMKMVVQNIDDYMISPFVESLYNWNMRTSNDNTIKTNVKVKALGSSALLVKEQEIEELINYIQLTANPLDANRVDRSELLSQLAGKLGLDEEVITNAYDEISEQPGGGQAQPQNIQGGMAQPVVR